MSYQLSFGKHEGHTYEWMFFKAPGYAQFIYENRIYRQEHNMDEDEGRYFLELYRRATSLGGICSQCKGRPVTRMGLTTHGNGCDLGAVGFYCDECEYRGGGSTGYFTASFFVDAYDLEPGAQKRVINEIKRHYIGTGNLTQKRMEEFFHNDTNFDGGHPGAFTSSIINGGLVLE